jgi:ribosomal protein L37AE/L43A
MKTLNETGFVTVLTFTYPYEAAVIRGRLESEGIECFVRDEWTVQVQPFYSHAIGGVKLQVGKNDLPQTMEILKEAGYMKDGNESGSTAYSRSVPVKVSVSGKPDKNKIICPFCRSEEVSRSRTGGWMFLLASLLIWYPVPLFNKKIYHCSDCGQDWTNHRNHI